MATLSKRWPHLANYLHDEPSHSKRVLSSTNHRLCEHGDTGSLVSYFTHEAPGRTVEETFPDTSNPPLTTPAVTPFMDVIWSSLLRIRKWVTGPAPSTVSYTCTWDALCNGDDHRACLLRDFRLCLLLSHLEDPADSGLGSFQPRERR